MNTVELHNIGGLVRLSEQEGITRNQGAKTRGFMETNTTIPGSLGLEMPRQQQLHHTSSPFAASFITHDANYSAYGVPILPSTKSSMTAPKQQITPVSDEAEKASGYAAVIDDRGSLSSGRRLVLSSWQRMNWTDDMVRMLIMVVYLVGDEVAGSEQDLVGEKKKLSGAGDGGASASLLQKKGKWKSVSKTMLEKGFCVSPQQCEDKFNDLNKRYKRVNDILGRGTACRVVENQNLLETMDHVPAKRKEEVRKLLNSKHLFFREMCAYHTSCAGGHQALDANRALPLPPQQQQSSYNQQQQQLLQFSSSHGFHQENTKRETAADGWEDHNAGSADDDNDDEWEDDLGDRDYQQADTDKGRPAKRMRQNGTAGGLGVGGGSHCLSPAEQRLQSELAVVLQDSRKSVWEQRQWILTRCLMLEEQRVRNQWQSLELEKERFKWAKFNTKKEREFERMRVDNERMRLESEGMLLVLRQKEMEMETEIRRAEARPTTG